MAAVLAMAWSSLLVAVLGSAAPKPSRMPPARCHVADGMLVLILKVSFTVHIHATERRGLSVDTLGMHGGPLAKGRRLTGRSAVTHVNLRDVT
jgi:hypothetical protein